MTSPKEVGVNARISSSAPLTPGTEELPVVEIKRRPSGKSESASILSLLVSRPTSLPSKYMLKVPAVFVPKDVPSKRTTSCGVTEIPLTVTELLNDIKAELEAINVKATRSVLPKPTSDPSNARRQFCPSNSKMSSSADETPPTVCPLVNERYSGLLE